jgi:hypothetical protein
MDSIRRAMAAPRGGRPVCLICGRGLASGDERLRLRGGAFVHSGCATYDMRRRRTGAERLGYPGR